MPNSAKTVAIIGTGPAGLFAAWALQNDGYQHDHLTLARRAEGVAGEDQPVDIPMRTFSGSYYSNLFRALEFLKVETRVHRFRYNFHRGGTQYFQFFSNFHKITPCLQNTAWVNLYALACYLWYTIAVFLPPRVRGTATSGQRKGETKTLDQYARRIRLPSTFLEWYLLPLFSSVATCSHADLRECPAAYIVNYRKGTIGAHHRTIVDMRALQGLLTRNVFQRLQTEVRSVRSESGRVELQFFKSNDKTGLETEVFDFAVLATTEGGGRFISVTTAKVSEGTIEDFGSETLELKTYSNPSSGPITHSVHRHRSGAEVVVSPCQDDDLAQEPSHGESQAFYLRRPLPTPQSHDLLLSVLRKVPTHERRAWINGQDGVYLAGGYASAGLPLPEACVRSALVAAVAIGAKLPFAIVRNTPF
ncbi:hypothetical protein CDV57_06269 [Aspergillus fumigatus]|nr:hypothetical protein CDV57_06269 [Aspergillus fumigatus]